MLVTLVPIVTLATAGEYSNEALTTVLTLVGTV
jgi:hypothetical protein